MKLRMALTVALVAGAALFACGGGSSGKGSTGGSGSGSGAGATSGGATGGATGGGSSTGASGGSSGGSTSASTTSGGSTSSGTTSGTSAGTTTGSSCAHGGCTYDNDCGGASSCFNGCCVPTSDSCSQGSCAYGSCAPGWVCDTTTDCCAPDGGSGTGTGSGGGTSGGWSCDFDGGARGGSCNPECDHGFHCENGACVLNGGGGPIQVTLQWNQGVDLDLHVVDPTGCETYYGNKTGCQGQLDLDSNPGCNLDNVDIENVIYADGGTPPSGTYTVRVDDYESNPSSGCVGGGQSIPYKVIVRHNGVTDTYCSGFPASDLGDNGSQGSGATIASFTYP